MTALLVLQQTISTFISKKNTPMHIIKAKFKCFLSIKCLQIMMTYNLSIICLLLITQYTNMSYNSLNESHADSQIILRMQYQSKLKDDAITKATKIIQQLQDEVVLLKEERDILKKDNNKKIIQIEDLQQKHKQLNHKITFLQECLNEKDKQINQLYERMKMKRQKQQKKFNNFLTISYEPDRNHRSEKKYNQSKTQKQIYFDHLNSTCNGGTPIRSTTKKYAINTSFDEDPIQLRSLSKQMVQLKKDLMSKDKHNIYLLKKNKAIEDYLSVLEDVNHPLLRRQTPKIHRGYLI